MGEIQRLRANTSADENHCQIRAKHQHASKTNECFVDVPSRGYHDAFKHLETHEPIVQTSLPRITLKVSVSNLSLPGEESSIIHFVCLCLSRGSKRLWWRKQRLVLLPQVSVLIWRAKNSLRPKRRARDFEINLNSGNTAYRRWISREKAEVRQKRMGLSDWISFDDECVKRICQITEEQREKRRSSVCWSHVARIVSMSREKRNNIYIYIRRQADSILRLPHYSLAEAIYQG